MDSSGDVDKFEGRWRLYNELYLEYGGADANAQLLAAEDVVERVVPDRTLLSRRQMVWAELMWALLWLSTIGGRSVEHVAAIVREVDVLGKAPLESEVPAVLSAATWVGRTGRLVNEVLALLKRTAQRIDAQESPDSNDMNRLSRIRSSIASLEEMAGITTT